MQRCSAARIHARRRAERGRRATLKEHTRRFGVFSVRSLLLLWVCTSVATLGYAYVDLQVTPGLVQERGFSIDLDLSRVGELWHWGGRLLNEGAMGLLIFNAIIVGGFLALIALWVGELPRRALQPRSDSQPAASKVTTTVAFGSVPPPAQ